MNRPLYTLTLGWLTLAAALTGGCSGDPEPEPSAEAGPADALNRRERDSVISTLPIPGASGVGRALRAADSARARANVHDSLARLP